MDTEFKFSLKHGKPISGEEADKLGFCVEGPIVFLFDLGSGVGVLGYNTINEEWQFDASINDHGETWQFVEKDVHNALKRADRISKLIMSVYNSPGINHNDFDHIEILDACEE